MARTAANTISGRRKQKNGATKVIILGVVFVFVLVMSVQIVNLYNKNQGYIEREQILNEQLAAEERRAAELEDYEKYINSQEFIEDTAKSRLGLIYKDEIVFREEK